jgi:hypothetical protein
MQEPEPKVHLNVGGPRGWTTACGIESSSFVDKDKKEDHFMVDCKRCLKSMELGFAEDHSVGPSRDGGSVKRSHRAEGRNWVD